MKKKKEYTRIVDNKMRWQGDTDTEKKIIRVNKEKSKKKSGSGGVLDTIVHEETHAKHPNMHEKTVYKKTPNIIKTLASATKKKLYARYRG